MKNLLLVYLGLITTIFVLFSCKKEEPFEKVTSNQNNNQSSTILLGTTWVRANECNIDTAFGMTPDSTCTPYYLGKTTSNYLYEFTQDSIVNEYEVPESSNWEDTIFLMARTYDQFIDLEDSTYLGYSVVILKANSDTIQIQDDMNRRIVNYLKLY